MCKYDIMFISISMNTFKYMCVLIDACVYIFVLMGAMWYM